ncbi:hypothetical protein LOZ65_006867, partial [Ophidiomyces ophidiicola]
LIWVKDFTWIVILALALGQFEPWRFTEGFHGPNRTMSLQLVHIAELISEDSIAGQNVNGKQQQLADRATLEAIQTFWGVVPQQWKTFLNAPGSRVSQRLREPDRPHVQELEEHVKRLVWQWAENPAGFYSIDGDACPTAASQLTVTRPLDDFILSMVRLQDQRVVNDIRWRILTACFSRAIKKLLPPRSRLPTRKAEVVAIFHSSGLVSETILDISFEHFREFLHAGRVYNRVIEECGSEGALIYIPQLSRQTWDAHMPLKDGAVASALSPIKDAIQKKSNEVWGPEGIQERSGNEVIKVLFDHFNGVLESARAFVPYDEGNTHHQRPIQGGHTGSKQSRRRSTRKPRNPSDSQRVRKPGTPRVGRLARLTHKQPTQQSQERQEPSSDSSHIRDSSSSRLQNNENRWSQNDRAQEGPTVDWNGRADSTAAEHGQSNEDTSPQCSTAQGNEHAAPNPGNGYLLGPTHGAGLVASGSGMAAGNGFGLGRIAGNHGLLGGQALHNPISEQSNRLVSISVGDSQRLPPIAVVTSGTPRGEDWNQGFLSHFRRGFAAGNLTPSNNWPMVPAPIPGTLTSNWLADHSPIRQGAFVEAQSNGLSGLLPLPTGNVTIDHRPSDAPFTSNGRPVFSELTQSIMPGGPLSQFSSNSTAVPPLQSYEPFEEPIANQNLPNTDNWAPQIATLPWIGHEISTDTDEWARDHGTSIELWFGHNEIPNTDHWADKETSLPLPVEMCE